MAICSYVHHLQQLEAKLINKSFKNSLSLFKRENWLNFSTTRTIKRQSASKGIGAPFLHRDNNPKSVTGLWKPFIFTACFSGGTLITCAIWQYENEKKIIPRWKGMNLWQFDGSNWSVNEVKKPEWRNRIHKAWDGLSDAEKLYFLILLTNGIVYLAWKVPKLERTMLTYFSNYPLSKATCWPLLFATFSHYNGIHIAMNMYALKNFLNISVISLGKEQFVSLYLIGGVMSSFTSLVYRVMKKKSGPSLGASGAILTVIGYISAKYPDVQLSIIGLPQLTFTAENGIRTIILIDLMGLIFGWKYFDHAAHLGGVFFGMFWHYWGSANIWQNKELLLHYWQKLKNSMK